MREWIIPTRGGIPGSKLTWKFLGQLFPRRYIMQFLLLWMVANETMNEGWYTIWRLNGEFSLFFSFFFSFFCRPRKWVERVESSWGIWCFHRGYISYAWYILKVHFLRTHLRNDLSSNKIGGSISGEVVNCSINCSFLSTLLNNSFVKLLIVSILFLYIYEICRIYTQDISFSKRNYNNEMMSNSKNEESFAT